MADVRAPAAAPALAASHGEARDDADEEVAYRGGDIIVPPESSSMYALALLRLLLLQNRSKSRRLSSRRLLSRRLYSLSNRPLVNELTPSNREVAY